MNDVPNLLKAKRRGEFFPITDDFYESIDQEKHEQTLLEEEAKEEE